MAAPGRVCPQWCKPPGARAEPTRSTDDRERQGGQVRALLLFWVVVLACACTPHEVRCDGRLKPINGAAASGGGHEHLAPNSRPGAP